MIWHRSWTVWEIASHGILPRSIRCRKYAPLCQIVGQKSHALHRNTVCHTCHLLDVLLVLKRKVCLFKKKGNWTVIIIYDDWNNTVFSSSNFTVNWTKPNKASCWMLGIFRFLAHWSTSELSGEKKKWNKNTVHSWPPKISALKIK